MLNCRFLSYAGQIILGAAIFALLAQQGSFATCTGADPCNACKNCKYCMHCAKHGGTCGICRRA
jgi:hypothetical protein